MKGLILYLFFFQVYLPLSLKRNSGWTRITNGRTTPSSQVARLFQDKQKCIKVEEYALETKGCLAFLRIQKQSRKGYEGLHTSFYANGKTAR